RETRRRRTGPGRRGARAHRLGAQLRRPGHVHGQGDGRAGRDRGGGAVAGRARHRGHGRRHHCLRADPRGCRTRRVARAPGTARRVRDLHHGTPQPRGRRGRGCAGVHLPARPTAHHGRHRVADPSARGGERMSTLVRRLAELATTTREHGLPTDLRDDVARRVLDVLGNSLAATSEPPARAVGELVREWGGAGRATAIGGGLLPEPSAALMNGTLAHSLDFDDTHLPSVLHPSASVVPAALAVAESRGADGAALLDAIGVGVEVAVRLGMAGYDSELGNSVFFENGLHATAICGAVGGAVAAAMLSGVDTDGIADTVGIAASMGSGLLEANRTGGTVKRIHCGWAAHAAVTAAGLALTGITGP